jgi:creatinine amidohydrolase
MKTVRIREMLGSQLKHALETARFAVLPFGAVEDHGAFGTLGMDTYPAEFLADELARRLRGVVLPVIEYGYLPLYTRDRTGSVPVRHELLVGLVEDVLAAAYRDGIRGVVVMNGNGPNASVVEVAGERVCYRYPDRFLLLINCYDVLSDEYLRTVFPKERSGGHGGAWEVSVMHAIVPETISDVSGVPDEPFRISLGRGTKVLSSGGKGIWDPAWTGYEGVANDSSSEKGRQILDASAEAITKIVSDFLRYVDATHDSGRL